MCSGGAAQRVAVGRLVTTPAQACTLDCAPMDSIEYHTRRVLPPLPSSPILDGFDRLCQTNHKLPHILIDPPQRVRSRRRLRYSHFCCPKSLTVLGCKSER
jgi:hypothetical protein